MRPEDRQPIARELIAEIERLRSYVAILQRHEKEQGIANIKLADKVLKLHAENARLLQALRNAANNLGAETSEQVVRRGNGTVEARVTVPLTDEQRRGRNERGFDLVKHLLDAPAGPPDVPGAL